MDENEVSINMMMVKRLWSMFCMKPEIQMCRNILKQYIFAKGIDVEKGDMKNAEEEWLQFCEEALDMAIVLGFVPYRIMDTPAGRIPVVIPIDAFRAFVKYDDGKLTFTLRESSDTSRDPNEEIKDSHVFADFGYNPSHNGTINSLLNSVLPDLHFALVMQDTARSMEIRRATPPMITETQEHANKSSDDIEYGFYADVDVAQAAEEAKFQRTSAQMKALFEQQDLYRRWLGDEDADATPSGMYPLPAGHKYVNTALPEGRSDYTAIRRVVEDIVFGTFGVPRSLIFSDGTHRGDQEGTQLTFTHTVTWWKRTLGRLASEAYMIIGAKDLAKQVRENKRKLEGGDETVPKRVRTSARDIYEAKKKTAPRFLFPTAPSLRLDEIHMMYDRGALTWKTYLEVLKLMTDLPIDPNIPEPAKEEDIPQEKKEGESAGAVVTKDGEVVDKGHKLNPEKDLSTTTQNKQAKDEAKRAKKNKVN